MSSVWFISPGVDRVVISVSDWAGYGIPAASDSVWEASNGWSLPEAGFTQMQLNILDGDPNFLLGMPDTPRTFPIPVDFQNDDKSNFAYFLATKQIYDNIAAIGGVATFIQQTDPAVTNAGYTGPAVWYVTDVSGNIVDVKVRT